MFGTSWTPAGPSRPLVSTPAPKPPSVPFSTPFGGAFSTFPTNTAQFAPAFAAPGTWSSTVTPTKGLKGLSSRPYDVALISGGSLFQITELVIPAHPSRPTKPLTQSEPPNDPFYRGHTDVLSMVPDNVIADIFDILLLIAPADDVIAFGRVNKHLHRAAGKHLRQVLRYKVTPIRETTDLLVFPAPCVQCTMSGCSFVTTTKSITIAGFPDGSTPVNLTIFLSVGNTSLQRLDIQSPSSHTYTLSTNISLPNLVHFSGPIPDLIFLESLASSPHLQTIELIDRTSAVGETGSVDLAAMLARLGVANARAGPTYAGKGVRKVKLRMHAGKGKYGWELVNALMFWPKVKEVELEFQQEVQAERVQPLPWYLIEPIFNRLPKLQTISLISKLAFKTPSTNPPSPSSSPPPLRNQPSPIFLCNLATRLKERRVPLLRFNNLSLQASPRKDKLGVKPAEDQTPLRKVGYRCVWNGEGWGKWQDGWGCVVAVVEAGRDGEGRAKGYRWEGGMKQVDGSEMTATVTEDTSLKAIPLDELSQTLEWLLEQKTSEVKRGLVELVEFGGVEGHDDKKRLDAGEARAFT